MRYIIDLGEGQPDDYDGTAADIAATLAGILKSDTDSGHWVARVVPVNESNDSLTLSHIARVLSGTEWDSSTTVAIAELVQASGRTIAPFEPGE